MALRDDECERLCLSRSPGYLKKVMCEDDRTADEVWPPLVAHGIKAH
jgi:hypothetical protein